VAKKISFANPFAKQIRVFAESIHLIIGFANNEFAINFQKLQKHVWIYQKNFILVLALQTEFINH